MIAPRARLVTPRWQAFSRPYYDFRPHVRIQLGFYVGYPVMFPSAYDYPYPYTDVAPTYGYYGRPPGVAGIGYGGVSFDVTPYDAGVYVDGTYAGPVENFYPTSPPLTLEVGVHHIDIIAPGYLTLAFDVSIVPGQVIPYRGTLQFVQP
jgi:hypothetical protein